MKRLLPLTLLAAAQLFAQGSRIELRSHPSAILGLQKNYNIYLPEGYDQDSLRYPVVYLFRGHEREWANPTEDGSSAGETSRPWPTRSIRRAIGKMVLVMPGMSDSGPAPSTSTSRRSSSLTSTPRSARCRSARNGASTASPMEGSTCSSWYGGTPSSSSLRGRTTVRSGP